MISVYLRHDFWRYSRHRMHNQPVVTIDMSTGNPRGVNLARLQCCQPSGCKCGLHNWVLDKKNWGLYE